MTRLTSYTRRLPFKTRQRVIGAACALALLPRRRGHRDAYLKAARAKGLTVGNRDLAVIASAYAANEWRRLACLAMFGLSSTAEWNKLLERSSYIRSRRVVEDAMGGHGKAILIAPHIGVSALVPYVIAGLAEYPVTVVGERSGLAEAAARRKSAGMEIPNGLEAISLPDRWAALRIVAAIRRRRLVFVMPDLVVGLASEHATEPTPSGLPVAVHGLESIQRATNAPVLSSIIVYENGAGWKWITEEVEGYGDGQLAKHLATELSDLIIRYADQLTLRVLRS